MDVRLARPTDAPLVLALALDEDAHLVKSPKWSATHPVMRTVLRAVLPLPAVGRTWIARDGSSVAMVEAQPRQYVIGWDVTRLAVRGDPDPVLGPVVQAVITHLQSRGVPRLFARCQENAAQDLKVLGFQALARECTLLGPEGGVRGDDSLPVDSRYRMPQDAWPLHQLESDVTPPLVRQLEGLASIDWSRQERDMSEIVVERDGRVVAWVGWGARRAPDLTQVGLLVHPGYKEVGPSLLQHVLAQGSAGSRSVARVRDYQVEALRTFLEAGFQVILEEILMVKHARVELARVAKARLQMAHVPSMRPFHSRLGSGPTILPAVSQPR